MTKRFSYDLTYDAPLPAVSAMLADPAFHEAVLDAQHVVRREVSVTSTPEGFTVDLEQVQTAQGIPSFARKVVGDEITIIVRQLWAGHRADLEVSIPGKPGDVGGTAALTERDGGTGGTVETVEFVVKVGIPLVGGRLEDLVGDLLGKALRAEQAVGRDYLSR